MNHSTPRILCISPFFVPRADAEAYCGAKLMLELQKKGVDVTVLCRDPESLRPYAIDDSRLWESLKKNTVKISVDKSAFYAGRMALRYATPGFSRWIPGAVEQAVALHGRQPFDLVYSRSLPMEAHIAGYWTSRRLGIPWFVNINDPWDWHLMPPIMRKRYHWYHRSLSSFWMRRTLKTASRVFYPSSRLRDFHLRVSGVPHSGATLPHIGYARKAEQTADSMFRLVHAGRLGGLERRSPDALLKGLRLFLEKAPEARHSLRLILVGPEDSATRARVDALSLQSVVEITGRVNYERSLDYISSATVCVLVEGELQEGLFLPSKLADYVAANKPVLALSPKVGAVADLLAYKGIVRADVGDVESIALAIGAFYEGFKCKSMSAHCPSVDLIGLFDPSSVTDEFCRNVRSVLAGHANGLL